MGGTRAPFSLEGAQRREHKDIVFKGREIFREAVHRMGDAGREVLKQAGYATGCFGKWGLGYPKSEGDPILQGFDVFFGYNCQRNAHSFYRPFLIDQSEKLEIDPKQYTHDLIMERALKFIRENRDGPFFCYMPVTIPHAAMHA